MAAPDLALDHRSLIRAARASLDRADALREAAGEIRIAHTRFSAFAAEQRLRERTRDLASRLRHNGRSLEDLGAEARHVDDAVAEALLRLYRDGWR